ncbi:fasciclin domain-containing protein [Mucilaginibacter paludis]|uniref:Beta-Ig-H3/fasciclin n=1 Tax=Mucilaginibacter paludis DSM 18603 TaxID=714943 RepID=H1Y0W0_9SPHI|nr:fasciclin domain-containing protein [Mucilaginibacter paludis]EHQ29185.1 beta-Ig-H3/fasciclin [Mucilaginibacter paludis DSM 18603]
MKHHLCHRYYVLLVFCTMVISSCKSPWDKHDTVTNSVLAINLLDQINQNPNLSKFSQYLAQTGYDKVIASSKTFTVWAPTNTALQAVDASILGDTVKLKQFIGNHLSNLSYTTNMASPSIRVKTLNGKNATFTPTTFENANITTANQYVANGILHIIDAAVIPKLNIWDYVNSLTTVGQKQLAYLQSQNYIYQDTTLATVTGVGSNGKPILKPGTGLVNANYYLNQTANLKDEDQMLTYIVLTDAAYDTENNKVNKYFATSSIDSTAKLAAFNVTKDLVIKGAYVPSALPDTLLSINNIKVPVLRGANIVQSYAASNGVVYVMSSANFKLVEKVPPIVIQGEDATFFARTDKGAAIVYRLRKDPAGIAYKDIYIATNTAATLTPLFYAGYTINNANSVTYKVYQRAINEQMTAGTAATSTAPAVQPAPILFSQQLSIYSPFSATPTQFGFQTVASFNYSEVLIGTFTNTRYGYLKFTNSGANSTTANANSITLDYLKLVPTLP